MKGLCFLFEGQGAQIKGMGEEIFNEFNTARRVFETGSEITGIDLKRMCFETEQEELNLTKNAQLSVFTVSSAIFAVLKGKDIIPEFYAGFSLGECSAMCAAGVFSLEDGFRIIQKRGALMQRCAEENPGAMYAIIGLDDGAVEEECEKAKGYVAAANYNCPSQLVIAGDESSAAQAAEQCLARGASKAVRLPVNGAFHTKHMEAAAKEFCEFLKQFSFSAPAGRVFSNVYGGELKNFSNIPEYMSAHIISPVKWKTEIEEIVSGGGGEFYELGCGRTLTGFNRKIDRGLRTASLSLNVLKRFLEGLQ